MGSCKPYGMRTGCLCAQCAALRFSPARWRSVMQVRAGLMHGVWPLLGRSPHVEARAFALTPHDASETQAQRQAAIEVRPQWHVCMFVCGHVARDVVRRMDHPVCTLYVACNRSALHAATDRSAP